MTPCRISYRLPPQTGVRDRELSRWSLVVIPQRQRTISQGFPRTERMLAVNWKSKNAAKNAEISDAPSQRCCGQTRTNDPFLRASRVGVIRNAKREDSGFAIALNVPSCNNDFLVFFFFNEVGRHAYRQPLHASAFHVSFQTTNCAAFLCVVCDMALHAFPSKE